MLLVLGIDNWFSFLSVCHY